MMYRPRRGPRRQVSIREDPDRKLEEALVQLALERKVIDDKTLGWIRGR